MSNYEVPRGAASPLRLCQLCILLYCVIMVVTTQPFLYSRRGDCGMTLQPDKPPGQRKVRKRPPRKDFTMIVIIFLLLSLVAATVLIVLSLLNTIDLPWSK